MFGITSNSELHTNFLDLIFSKPLLLLLSLCTQIKDSKRGLLLLLHGLEEK
jgi:hypothetical protein